MHLLPTHLAPLADAADSRDSGGRFALRAVHLTVHPDNTYTAEATDTKMLVRVTGPCVAPAEEYPEHVGMTAAPNGRTDALIPTAAWKKAFGGAAKTTRRIKSGAACSVAVKIGKELATFGATDLDSYPVEQTRLVDGKFPPTNDIIKGCRKKARVKFAVDPHLAAKLFGIMADLVCDYETQRVEVELGDPNSAILVSGQRRADGTTATAILMPLPIDKGENAGDDDDADDTAADESALVSSLRNQVAELQGAVTPLTEENGKLAGERNRLAEQFAELSRQVDTIQANARGLAEDRDRLQAANAELVRKLADAGTATEDRRHLEVVRGWLADLGPRLAAAKEVRS